jgi:hypothetical protein
VGRERLRDSPHRVSPSSLFRLRSSSPPPAGDQAEPQLPTGSLRYPACPAKINRVAHRAAQAVCRQVRLFHAPTPGNLAGGVGAVRTTSGNWGG